ncbi:tRNA dimethylallyltransferase [Aquimarina intermedia]|uniref:tRNA dimethylallyltransferase n=2 Tax=Aquimarina intermedia TaxID=350814 RepID=A0A5S5C1C4_9FLAO|nr:tRNA dimethylallyltransferase [Aquimarina intermedia]
MQNIVITADTHFLMNKNLIVVTGTTAIGKTSLAIAIAKHLKCEIISADSRQFFKEMNIGTAVPSPEELAAIPHHFIQHRSIHEPYSVGDFEKDAMQLITSLFQANKNIVLVGGSGLYINAIVNGLDEFPEVDETTKSQIQQLYNEKGITALQEQLKLLDPMYYNKVDLLNTHRVMRAVEVSLSSGQPYSSFLTKNKKTRPFKCIKIGLTAERSIIYDRINYRVDQMVNEGLVTEVSTLYEYRNLNALNTVGYKELFSYLDKKWELDFAISEIKKNTRRFAKRQLTWFKKDKEITWFDIDTNREEILSFIEKNSL